MAGLCSEAAGSLFVCGRRWQSCTLGVVLPGSYHGRMVALAGMLLSLWGHPAMGNPVGTWCSPLSCGVVLVCLCGGIWVSSIALKPLVVLVLWRTLLVSCVSTWSLGARPPATGPGVCVRSPLVPVWVGAVEVLFHIPLGSLGVLPELFLYGPWRAQFEVAQFPSHLLRCPQIFVFE